MSIRLLPNEEVRRIRSSVVITSLNQAVTGLLKNSLDAGATKITVTVDYSRGNCTVRDDGHGIPQHEFSESGGLGQVHYTSRYPHHADVHGSRGEFLASLAALSLVTVTSRHQSQPTTSSLSIRNSTVLSRRLTCSPEHEIKSSAHGTRVAVWDLFGSMGVRVKQRPAAEDKHLLDTSFFRLARDVAAVLLSWAKDVTVRITESVADREIYVRPSRKEDGNRSKPSSRISRVIVHCGLADEATFGTWLSVWGSAGLVSVSGCISLNAVATRRAQFISLGIHPLNNDRGSNVLYEEVNRVFVNSDFAVIEEQETSRSKQAATSKEIHRKRGLQRWPMFYFRIEPLGELSQGSDPTDALLEQSRILSQAAHLLRTISFEFLRKHHFRPRQIETALTGTKQGPRDLAESVSIQASAADEAANSSTSPIGTSDPSHASSRFPLSDSLWQRIKVGKARTLSRPANTPSLPEQKSRFSTPDSFRISGEEHLESNTERQTPLVHRSGLLSRRPFAEEATASEPGTGQCEPVSRKSADALVATNQNESGTSCKTSQGNNKEPSEWLQQMLSTWNNPVFSPAGEEVPRLEEVMAAAELSSLHACSDHSQNPFDVSTLRRQAKLSKSGLRSAEVISQVDEKFVLIKLRPETSGLQDTSAGQGGPLLVLVDQHAADERCQLESLMKDYFFTGKDGPRPYARTASLDSTVRIEFSHREAEMLGRLRSYFQRWGIHYTVHPTQQVVLPKSARVVEITSLPPSILERGRMEPRLLADLLRSEMWKMADSGEGLPASSLQQAHGRTAAGDESRGDDWTSLFQGCPQGILDMLNSRSCRSAIMFNDVLNLQECEDLVGRLSQCAFPFQCAHGRPSMVPLVDLSSFAPTFQEYAGDQYV